MCEPSRIDGRQHWMGAGGFVPSVVAMDVHHFGKPLARPETPRMAGARRLHTRDLVVGEWSLTAAAWTDRHEHEEINYVLDGELYVTCDGIERIVRAGEAVFVDAGSVAARLCRSEPRTHAVRLRSLPRRPPRGNRHPLRRVAGAAVVGGRVDLTVTFTRRFGYTAA